GVLGPGNALNVLPEPVCCDAASGQDHRCVPGAVRRQAKQEVQGPDPPMPDGGRRARCSYDRRLDVDGKRRRPVWLDGLGSCGKLTHSHHVSQRSNRLTDLPARVIEKSQQDVLRPRMSAPSFTRSTPRAFERPYSGVAEVRGSGHLPGLSWREQRLEDDQAIAAP